MQENLKDIHRISKDIIKYLNIGKFISSSLHKEGFEVRLTKHAVKRAEERNICIELIEKTINEGRIIRFWKNRLKIEKTFNNFKIRCVDEIRDNELKIVTIIKSRWLYGLCKMQNKNGWRKR